MHTCIYAYVHIYTAILIKKLSFLNFLGELMINHIFLMINHIFFPFHMMSFCEYTSIPNHFGNYS